MLLPLAVLQYRYIVLLVLILIIDTTIWSAEAIVRIHILMSSILWRVSTPRPYVYYTLHTVTVTQNTNVLHVYLLEV